MVQSSCTELGAVISVPTGMHKTLCDKRHSGTRPPPPTSQKNVKLRERQQTHLLHKRNTFITTSVSEFTVLYPNPKMEREDIAKSPLNKKSAAGNQGYPGKTQTLLGLVGETQLPGRRTRGSPVLSQFPAEEAEWPRPLPKRTVGSLSENLFHFVCSSFWNALDKGKSRGVRESTKEKTATPAKGGLQRRPLGG